MNSSQCESPCQPSSAEREPNQVSAAAAVRERLEELIDHLREGGHGEEEISSLLATSVAGAMERLTRGRTTPSSEPVLVNLTTVPLRFSVSAVMALYYLQGASSQPARLGETVGISAAAMTGILDTLEGRGLVRRVRDPRDRRKIHVELTAKGRRTVGGMFLN